MKILLPLQQGLVVVWELQLERRGRPERVSVSSEHRGHNITSLCWDTSTLRVFVGDSVGKVSYLRAGSSKLGKGSAFVIFPVQTVTTVDSRVVQLGYQDGRLLVSSLSHLADVAVHRGELFCLHSSGRLSHLSLLSAERCVERLLRRESWTLAATVCCMFQHTIMTSRARKSIPIDRLEHLKSQLSSSTQTDLITQLEAVILKLEPMDSASSSRRSSISSHESFNVLDCGIYRVISRRGSQSDEETSSLMNHVHCLSSFPFSTPSICVFPPTPAPIFTQIHRAVSAWRPIDQTKGCSSTSHSHSAPNPPA
ncbi:hypothetical protein GOODEAATRI_023526 [Goodea atripinnis]|uniref:Uncharacterized protein n=1 Tax=Goodea atripinnis TaxID=208336 RepID=A0ABV0N4S3_9TELE